MMIYYLYIHSYMFRSYDHHQAEKYIAYVLFGSFLCFKRSIRATCWFSLRHECEEFFHCCSCIPLNWLYAFSLLLCNTCGPSGLHVMPLNPRPMGRCDAFIVWEPFWPKPRVRHCTLCLSDSVSLPQLRLAKLHDVTSAVITNPPPTTSLTYHMTVSYSPLQFKF
jgi:hypothetical protein